MGRVWNFSAGPSVLPESVLHRAAEEMTDYRGSGQSVMEMSHRSAVFKGIAERTEASLRQLLALPDNYRVLFLQGGAFTQFAMVPMNLMRRSRQADYVNTGSWSKKAIAEARKFGEVRVVADSSDRNFTYIPDLSAVSWNSDADYVHITSNNTIYGTRIAYPPDVGEVPLVVDMSSNILSEPIDVSRYGMIYAGAQKNAGMAGVTHVIIRDDLIGHAPENTPTMMNYRTHAKAGSMHNTPPCYAIYISGLVFDWLLENGGLEAMGRRNREKADLLYNFLDQSSLFKATVDAPHRSLMNVTFLLEDDKRTERFLSSAEEAGLVNLKGHRSVGGCRASIYNGMPAEGVQALVRFMSDFEARGG
ncbi:MAG: 3-phosphoserine/phosphohydroxythreonine transaminase [Acidobacteriota bacterium]|nr:3-phosphoserine/phosphohydroxythreonine transaminase [Acidobacteriota bacterium]